MRRIPVILGAFAVALMAHPAEAAMWRNVTDAALQRATGGWTNKADLADVNGDGRVDLLFANGSAYNRPGEEELNGVWLNRGNDESGVPRFEDVSDEALDGNVDFSRVFKGRDVTGDGIVDLIAGNTYQTRSRLYVGLGDGKFKERPELIPDTPASIGDLEVGDIDGDGDLDIVLADWGLDGDGELLDPFTAPGGRMLVWRNELDTEGRFVDATDDVMPRDVLVAWSWELELLDVDGDFDLDVLASCKSCEGSALFRNEGEKFALDPDGIPAHTNNYDFEPMFIRLPGEDDRRLAVITINDGKQVDPANQFDKQEHIFAVNDEGRFEDVTARVWPDEDNAGRDDNMVVVFDVESDGDPDFLIGALGPESDRLHVNQLDDDGRFRLVERTGLDDTPGTLGIALADLNGDNKLDVVQSQGELADPEEVWLGDEIEPDTAPPVIEAARATPEGVVLARVHDNKSPSRPHDWKEVVVRWSVDGQPQGNVALTWVGEFYWRGDLGDLPEGEVTFSICASDAAGNGTCGDEFTLGEPKTDDVADGDPQAGAADGCGCRADTPRFAWAVLLLLFGARRRGIAVKSP